DTGRERAPQDQSDGHDDQDGDVGQREVGEQMPNSRGQCHRAGSSRLAARDPTARKTNSTTKEITSSTIEIAAVPVRSSFSMSVRIHCDDTSVSPGTAPPISTTEPNSPMARENARPAPDRRDGSSAGRITCVKIVAL